MPLLGLWIGRGAAEDQTRQCPSRLGNRCRGILRDDLAYATRARARSTLRSDDESPRPSMRDLIEEASRLFSDALTLEFDEPSKCTLVRPNRWAASLCFRKSPST